MPQRATGRWCRTWAPVTHWNATMPQEVRAYTWVSSQDGAPAGAPLIQQAEQLSSTNAAHLQSSPANFFFLPFTNYQTVKRHKYLLAKSTVRDSMAMNCLLVCYQLSCCSAQWEVADFEWGSWTQSSSNWAFLSLVYVVKAEANPWVTPTQAVICHQIAVLLNEKPRRAHWLLPFSMQHNMDTSRFWALAQFLPSVLRG